MTIRATTMTTNVLVCCTLLFACEANQSSPEAESETEASEVQANLEIDGDASVDEPGRAFDVWARVTCSVPRSNACADGQVAAIARASNAGEILISQAVLPRLQTPAARALAERLIADHAAANQKLEAVLAESGIALIENKNSKGLTESAQHHAQMLATKSGPELDSAFVSHMLFGHARTLGSLDHLLIPSAEHRLLERYLRQTRATVARHTVLTVEVQALIDGTCGGELGAPTDAGAPPPSDAGAPEAPAEAETGHSPGAH